ncbi:MAG: UDP-N-acetylglucosamine 2-epimerase (hydrolyzing) [Oligoflexales bacterium]|nr:UDP-N-acetylglucosamine 2-epimerase (hydrolyzing) [Oligoflexales bacterium]
MRKICVVTGSRAEYGLLSNLMKAIRSDPPCKLQVVVTGMHLSAEFGHTYKVIESDGFDIDYKVDMLLSSDSREGISKSLGLGVIGFTDCFKTLSPDIVTVLGDRFEIFAAASAALIMNIPIAHIHGGETTEGAMDEAIRHSITKMAHLHFPVTDTYRRRIIQMGENPKSVFNFGTPGLECINTLKLLEKSELERELGISNLERLALVAIHPETLLKDSQSRIMKELFGALDELSDMDIIFTKSNADPSGREIGRLIDEYAEKRPRCHVFCNLGQRLFLSVLKNSGVMIGNSSSGIIEAPALGVPTVNIGGRQRGRLYASSIISCGYQADDILRSIKKGLSGEFKASIRDQKLPYGNGQETSYRIRDVLREYNLNNILMKKFYDLDKPMEAIIK